MTLYYYVLLSLLSGVAITLQGLINTWLRVKLPLPVIILINSLAGLLGILIWLAYWKFTASDTKMSFAGIPLSYYFSGLLGLLIVITGAVAFQMIGATWTLTLMIVGQLGLALLADHFGWLGVPKVPLGWMRVLGTLLVIIGCWLTSKK